MSKHLIKIDNPQHCAISVAHAGKDNQYCEAGDVVAIDWQPSAGWGLQEAHYIDEDGNVVAIDLSLREFTMPAKAITIGGTAKRFVVQDWTGKLDYDNIDNKPTINGVELEGDKLSSDFMISNFNNLVQFKGQGDTFVDIDLCLDPTNKPGNYTFILPAWDLTDITIPNSSFIFIVSVFSDITETTPTDIYRMYRSGAPTSQKIVSMFIQNTRKVRLRFRYGVGAVCSFYWSRKGEFSYPFSGDPLRVNDDTITCAKINMAEDIYNSRVTNGIIDGSLYNIGVQSASVIGDIIYYSYACILKTDEEQQKCIVVVANLKTRKFMGHFEVTATGITKFHGGNICAIKDQANSEPLLYVSTGYSPVCVVVRPASNNNSCTAVQEITYSGDITFTGCNWVVDEKNKFLYMYWSDTINNLDPSQSTAKFVKFSLPATSSATVTLTDADILEQKTVTGVHIVQGASIKNDLLYIGQGTTSGTYKIHVINIQAENILSSVTIDFEPEGVSFYDGHLIFTPPTPWVYVLDK